MSKNISKTPIVAVMGHVDHGKTSLLDRIRGTKVTATEAGGITQSVRAHQIEFQGKKITFIDTPGHEAFAGMRSRGAAIANIAVIVVAKDDGVQPQTIQACKFAKEQKLPIIIAMNKIDLEGIDDMKIFSQLATQANVLVEDMGGDAIVCKVSATTGEGIDHLLNTVLLLNEMSLVEEITRNGDSIAEGIVLESSMAKNWGNVALVILKNGNLDHTNDIYAANSEFSSKLRNLLDSNQISQISFESGDPVWITGLDQVLNVGQLVRFFNDKVSAEKEVKSIKEQEEYNAEINLDPKEAFRKLLIQQKNTNTENSKKVLNIILKTDTRGSMEVAKAEIEKLSDEFAEIKIMEYTEGEITERDIERAKVISAIVIGFRSGISEAAMKLAIHEKVLVRNYEIIYEMIDELDGALAGLLAPLEEEVEIARALVKQVFILSDKSIVAGSVIQKGIFLKGYRVKVLRDEEEISKGKIISLKILKNEVKEVQKGQDCGVQVDIKEEIQVGDFLVAYKIEKQ